MILFLMTAVLFGSTSDVTGQMFGRNKVQYDQFEWQVMKTAHADIYFYGGSEDLIWFVSEVFEEAYADLKEKLSYTPKRRFPVIVYSCHKDFEQTNVIMELIEESVGGFTELLKNRVVIPFDGSYEDLRHVIHHELTHAYIFDSFYGATGVSMSIIAQYPLWFFEGMAEYESQGWNNEAEMFLRDLTLSERLIPIRDLDYYEGSYLIYKEGQAIYHYLAEHYGEQKVGEFINNARMTRDLNAALKNTIGMGVEELSRQWEDYQKERYWPLVNTLERAEDIARRLTDHQQDHSVLNVSPVLSPDGKRLAFISDRNQYADIYVMSAIDGAILKHLLKGERSQAFESFHIGRPGLDWSPQGDRIVVAARSGSEDVLYVVDAESARIIHKLSFDLDAVFTPSWSPDGNRIVFVGLSQGTSDIYVVEVESGRLTRLMNDCYDDRDPAWSPDGTTIAFISDRPDPGDTVWNYGAYALFTMDTQGGQITKRTNRTATLNSPTWSPDGDMVAFVCDFEGINDLWVLDLAQDSLARLTNVRGGVATCTWSRDGSRLAFSAFEDFGWDIYVMKDPLSDVTWMAQTEPDERVPENTTTLVDTSHYEVHDVGLKFSPDYVAGAMGYSTEYGVGGQVVIAVSDILGNHRILGYFDPRGGDIRTADWLAEYWYLPRRVDMGMTAWQELMYYRVYGNDLLVETERGVAALFQYPFSTFERVELNTAAYNYSTYRLDNYFIQSDPPRIAETSENVLISSVSLVHDNSIWGYTGPVDGGRWRLTAGTTLNPLGSELSFTSSGFDVRKYWSLGYRYGLAVRLVGWRSAGRDPRSYWMGGSQSLRGHDDYAVVGHNIGLLNLELRYPFIERFRLAFPPLDFRGVRGAAFVDLGGATDELDTFRAIRKDEDGYRLQDLKMGVGFGSRLRISILVLKLDSAWSTDLKETSRMRWHFSIGPEF